MYLNFEKVTSFTRPGEFVQKFRFKILIILFFAKQFRVHEANSRGFKYFVVTPIICEL